MPSEAPDVTLVLTASPEPIPDDEFRPCAYCNPTQSVEERKAEMRKKYTEEDFPENAGMVGADYSLPFGHKDGAGVSVPVCEMCLDGFPAEHGENTVDNEIDHQYLSDGRIGETVIETDEETGMEIHRRVPVNE